MERDDLSYAAGIFDGEGCVLIDRHKGKDGRPNVNHMLTVTIGMTDPLLPRFLYDLFGGHVSFNQRDLPGKSRRDFWVWRIKGFRAASCLKAMRPFVKLKAHQVDLAIEFQAMIDKRQRIGRGGRLKDSDIAARDAFYHKMRQLKHVYSDRTYRGSRLTQKSLQAVIRFDKDA